ncbi:MAG: Fic family protein [Polynucleobacter sp.]|jgi:cell filamentation protein|nr:Fic family protein [Polynucleobacter sp.]
MSRYDADNVYCYEDSVVLRNKLGITDQLLLEKFESDITSSRLIELELKPINGKFDLKHLQAIHFAIFQDIYDWAGKIRTVDISRENSRFANMRMLDSASRKLFMNLAKENLFKNQNSQDISSRLAHYLSEINVLHPFRDGNGRVQRVFIAQLALASGFKLSYSDLKQLEMYDAMEKAFFGDETQLASLILEKLTTKK